MSTRTTRRLTAGATAVALAGLGVIGLGATAANAVDTITPGPLFAGTFYLGNADGSDIAPGTGISSWSDTVNEEIALPAPGNTEDYPAPVPAGAIGYTVFLSPVGHEETPADWSAYQDYATTATWLAEVNPETLTSAVPTGNPSGQAAARTRGGDFSLGIAYRDQIGIINEYYIHISVTPVTGDFTYEPVEATPPTGLDTTTAITSAPSTTTGVQSGVPFNLTATVAPAAATGTITFKNGTTTLGTAPVQPDGTATLSGATIVNATTSPVTASITAVYSGDATYGTSTSSPAVTFPVIPGPIDTTTAVTATSGSGKANRPVVLKATVSPVSGTGAGSVVFTGSVDGGAPAPITGTVTVDAAGVAQATISSLGAGTWTIDAAFSGVAPYQNSASITPSTVVLAVVDDDWTESQTTDPQDVTVTIPAGILVITTPWTAHDPLDLGNAILDDATSTYYTDPKVFGAPDIQANGIQIIDRRAGAPGFTAQVASTDFTSGANSFPATHLGLVNLAHHQVTGNTLQATDVTVTDVPANTPGLSGTAQTFATYGSGHATGTAWISGDVELKGIPSSVQPGLYRATLTFTVL